MEPPRILIVEDEYIIANDIQASLEDMVYTVCAIVSTGEEAIEKIEIENPDLVLMDIMLKGNMDGIEASELIRSKFDVPVVYLTAYADENILQRAKVTEPMGYLLKPFKDSELRSTIEVALYKHRMEKERGKLIKELQEALKEIKTLRGILPLCSYCKKIRDDNGYWEQVDVYIHKHSQADISHSICPDCAKEHYTDLEIYDD